jgi:rod shape-determining protein MreD
MMQVMKSGGPWTKLDNFARSLAPGLITLVLILLSVMPTKIPGWSHIAPAFVLMSV